VTRGNRAGTCMLHHDSGAKSTATCDAGTACAMARAMACGTGAVRVPNFDLGAECTVEREAGARAFRVVTRNDGAVRMMKRDAQASDPAKRAHWNVTLMPCALTVTRASSGCRASAGAAQAGKLGDE
jgi:hypothetical protein